ncbi:MAG: hypothetical protein Kow0089_06090 [Desulfobulbaceae bacterium]
MKPSKILFIALATLFCIVATARADYEKIKIAVLPFSLQGENFETEDMGSIVAEWLITAFVKDGRFEVVERKLLGQVLEEQQMVEAGLVNQETASEIGRLLGVKVIITGSVMKLRDVIEVNSRIIDVASASIVTAENVRSRNVTSLQPLVVEMSEKIIKNFPLEGYVANREGDHVVIDLGDVAGVKVGMKFMAYKEGEVVRHPKTDEILYVKKLQTGVIRITAVQHKISEGIIVEETEPGSIEYGDYVKSMNELAAETSARTTEPVVVAAPVERKVPVQAAPVQERKAQPPPPPPRKMRPADTLSPEVRGYLDLLKGDDTRQERWAAKKLYRTYPYQPAMLREVNEVLLRRYNTNLEDKHHVDAMAWLCKLLANSRDPQYKSTVRKVAERTESPKIKKHAEKALTLF